MLGLVTFWVFQVLNGLTSMGMVWDPAAFHESLLRKPPQETYQLLGFSRTAVDMLHNNIRNHGSVLLVQTAYLAVQGPGNPLSFLLIGLTCWFSFMAHDCTCWDHTSNPIVMAIIDIKPLYYILAVNSVVGSAALLTYWFA